MKILSWRGPRGWSRWHLISAASDHTLCALEVPAFTAQLVGGPTEPEDDRVCLMCRERYGVSAAASQALGLLEEYAPRHWWQRRRWAQFVLRLAVAVAPVTVLFIYDWFFVGAPHTISYPGPLLSLGLSSLGINSGAIHILKRLAPAPA